MYQYTQNGNFWEWHKVGNDDICYCTNTNGDGVFLIDSGQNLRKQLTGTFSVHGLTENSAKRKIRAFMKDIDANDREEETLPHSYSREGLMAFADYYDKDRDNFPPCWATEYGKDVDCSFDDLIHDWGNEYTVDDWLEDNELEENEFNKDQYIKALVEYLEDVTIVLPVSNGNYIVFH